MDTFKNIIDIEVMLSKELVGKAPVEWGRNEWRGFYKSLRLTRLTPYTLAAMIWQGYPFTPTYDNGRRLESNFRTAQHMAVDFDSDGASLDYLMRPESFAWTFSSFAYSTPSSTENHPKSRVVFVFDQPITEPGYFRELYAAVAAEFEREGSKTDPACKDPLRLYYGSPDCRVVPNWSVLTADAAAYLIDRYHAEHPPPVPVIDNTVQSLPPSDDYIEAKINRLIQDIVTAPDGEKHKTLNKTAYTIGGFVGAGYVSRGEAVGLCRAAIVANGRADNLQAAMATIEEAIDKGAAAPLIIENNYKMNLDGLL